MTGQEFRDYVVRTFVRTDKDTEIYESTTDVVQMLMTSYPFDDFKTIKATDTIASGANSFSLPSDFLKFVSRITCLDTDWGRELEQVSAPQFERLFTTTNADSTDEGRPTHFCVVNGVVYVGPRPDLTTYVYRFIYEYFQDTDIVAGTTTVPFTSINRKMLKHYVLGALYQDLENAELSNFHNQLAANLYNTIVSVDKRNTKGITTINYRNI